MCTQAGGPCIACVEPGWPDIARPLFVEREDVGIVGANIDTVAKVAVGAAAVVAGVHAVRRMKGE
jgi:hydrogenase small subunit